MDRNWLKIQFDMHPEKTKADLAKALGLEASAISKILAGTRQIKASEYMNMRGFFGLPNDGERAENFGRDSYILEPLGLSEKENNPADSAQDSWVMPASLFENRTSATPDKIKIFDIREDAMIPDFQKGEKVLVDLSDRSPSPAGVFVISDGMGHMIRQCAYVPHSDPAEIRFSAVNNKYDSFTMPLTKAEIIGRVIAKLQWV